MDDRMPQVRVNNGNSLTKRFSRRFCIHFFYQETHENVNLRLINCSQERHTVKNKKPKQNKTKQNKESTNKEKEKVKLKNINYEQTKGKNRIGLSYNKGIFWWHKSRVDFQTLCCL